jgi:hypothetical protein
MTADPTDLAAPPPLTAAALDAFAEGLDDALAMQPAPTTEEPGLVDDFGDLLRLLWESDNAAG